MWGDGAVVRARGRCGETDLELLLKAGVAFGLASLLGIPHGGADHFVGRREAGEHLADAVFTQGPHAHFPGAGTKH